MKRVIAIILLCAWMMGLSTLSSCAGGPDSELRSGPWKGRIVDIETKEPIEGAVVVAYWERVWRTPAGNNVKFYDAKEVLTDKEGRYEVPAFRPLNVLPFISYLRGPRFIIFKPGYLSIERNLDENVISETIEFKKDGKTYRVSPGLVELPRMATKEERRLTKPSPIGEGDDWKKQRNLIRAIREEWEYIYGRGAGDLYKIEGDM